MNHKRTLKATRPPARRRWLTPACRWSYVWLLCHLRFKDATEMNGTESYLVRCLSRRDTGWFPVQRAMCLEDERLEEVPSSVRPPVVTQA